MSARDIILKWAKELGGSVHSFELMLDQHAHELAEQIRQARHCYDGRECGDRDCIGHYDAADLIDPEAQR